MTRQYIGKVMRSLLASALLNAPLLAQTTPASQNDNQIESKVENKLEGKNQFRDVKATVQNGLITLNGTVSLYQQKVDAARTARKAAKVKDVRNLITVAGPTVSDEELAQHLARKLTYVRVGYDSTFDYFALSVKDGVVTVTGDDRTGVGRDEALADIYNQPGVKDVVNEIAVEPVSLLDDGIRIRTARAIYRDPVLSRYAIDPARPIRIVVINGHVTLYGTVDRSMDKNVAGIRANQVFGAFTVENKLDVRPDQPGL